MSSWLSDNWGKVALIGGAGAAVCVGISLLVEANESQSKRAVAASRKRALKRANTSRRSFIADVFDAVGDGEQVNAAFSSEQLQSLFAKFKRASGGGNAISRDAFTAIFARMGVSDRNVIESAFQAWDADGNGEISFAEFASVIAVQKDGTQREKLEFLFEIWDVDGNGVISHAEMLKIYRTLCPGITDDQTNKAVGLTFRALDRDHSGTISRNEFARCQAFAEHFHALELRVEHIFCS